MTIYEAINHLKYMTPASEAIGEAICIVCEAAAPEAEKEKKQNPYVDETVPEA